ncbi:aspartyl-phosphate phosphatase Spo0E family protein [Natranaerobius trueperi]|uniref:Spo0E family sporulation regulatory protein-aspartic acid phosphatase n=1 Tax=Natranaerobius trueperi TaxID=759412 RepID=A0A226BWQ4_9FIRM|nr:aspartyl-phosphate phosphatase Spo0E family protein [Natranaerobius trueperi]OWZ83341.1 hypothetical protein CDO51_08975 [Natranaerobius trueperi]
MSLEKINRLRAKLHELVIENAPYEKILTLSQQLDELIVDHQKEKKDYFEDR